MKINNLLLVSILLIASFSVLSQTEQPKVIKRISVNDVYVQVGLLSEFNKNGTLSDFKTLAPQSTLLNNDFTTYTQSNGSVLTSNAGFSYMLGLQFRDREKTNYKSNPLLRLGVSYFGGTTLDGNLYKQERKHYDTLFSKQSGKEYYLDSVTTTNYSMSYRSQQIRFDGSLIFRTNPSARWSFYSGMGITIGASINAQTDVFYSKYTSGNGSSYSFAGSSYKFETYRNKNNIGFSGYIPMGIDFRIGKKREFWKMTHLFYELRTGINMTSISELRTITNGGIQNGLGVKVTWN